MKPVIAAPLALALALAGSVASAQELGWQTVRIRGEGRAALCNENMVFASYSGNSASFAFTELGLNLPAGTLGPGSIQEFGACQVRTRMTVPRSHYIAAIYNSVLGGVIKSRGARGFLRSSYFLRTASQPDLPVFPHHGDLGLLNFMETIFAPREEMNDPLLVQDGGYTFRPGEAASQCRWTRQGPVRMDLVVRVAIHGQRTRPDGAILVEVDGTDVSFDVAPAVRPCPR